MPKNSNRIAELYKLQGRPFLVLDDKLWVDYRRAVVPVGPPHIDYSLPEDQACILLEHFSGSLMARYTTGFETEGLSPWYAVICDNFKDISQLPAKNRSEIRRGLNNCGVEKIDAVYLSQHGYEVYFSAYERYKGGSKPGSEKKFRESKYITAVFEDVYHYWGVFHKNRLIAYSSNMVYSDEVVDYTAIKINPEYLKLYPGYALIYRMNQYYLIEQSFQYVNDGFRSIAHQTNFQDFLIRKFGFKKAYVGIKIFYKPIISLGLSLTFPFRGFLKRLNTKMETLYRLEEIHRESQKSRIE
jgi:hypothetical protein